MDVGAQSLEPSAGMVCPHLHFHSTDFLMVQDFQQKSKEPHRVEEIQAREATAEQSTLPCPGAGTEVLLIC